MIDYKRKFIGGSIMSDLSSTSCCRDNKNDNGISSIFMILILLSLCGGDNGLLGGFLGNSGCGGNDGCGCNNGLDGILPIILLLSLCGGSF
jgi:hypothetical protein